MLPLNKLFVILIVFMTLFSMVVPATASSEWTFEDGYYSIRGTATGNYILDLPEEIHESDLDVSKVDVDITFLSEIDAYHIDSNLDLFLPISLQSGESVTLYAEQTPGFNPTDFGMDDYQTVSNMPIGKRDHAQTTLLDGTVFISGGSTGSNARTSDAFIYDPSTDSYTAVSDLPTGRRSHAKSTLLDGTVFITGGDGGTSLAHIYDPSTDTYTAVSNLPTGKNGHAQSTLPDGTVFITGGGNTIAYIYDPSTDSYTTVSDLPRSLQWHAQSTLSDGTVLITGGLDGSSRVSDIYIYDPSTDWYTAGTNLPTAKRFHAQSTLLDGTVFITGGDSGSYLSQAHIYDPSTDSYTTAKNLPRAKQSHSQSTLPDGRVFFAGGQASGSSYQYMSEARIYTPLINEPRFSTSISENNGIFEIKVENTAEQNIDSYIQIDGSQLGISSDSESWYILTSGVGQATTSVTGDTHTFTESGSTILSPSEPIISEIEFTADSTQSYQYEIKVHFSTDVGGTGETTYYETFFEDGWFLIFIILAVCIWLMSQAFATGTAVIVGGLFGFSVLLIGLTDTIPVGQIIFVFMLSLIGAAIYLRSKGGIY